MTNTTHQIGMTHAQVQAEREARRERGRAFNMEHVSREARIEVAAREAASRSEQGRRERAAQRVAARRAQLRARNVATASAATAEEVFRTTRREGESRNGSSNARVADWRADSGTVTHARATRGR